MYKMILMLLLIFLSAELFGLKKDFNFMGLKLGMTQQEITNVLLLNPRLKIDESRFFGKINDALPFIIKAVYPPYIDNIYAQFYSNICYGITIQFNPDYFDYFSLSENLEDKYGMPKLKTSRIVLWEGIFTNSPDQGSKDQGKDIRLRLEYPSTVKIFNYKMMNEMNNELHQNNIKITNESVDESNRRAILSEL